MKSHCINGHPYTEENTEHRKDGTFCCKTCRRSRQNYVKATKAGRERDPNNRAPDRILDLLAIDGGWLTSSGIAVALDLPEETVHRALYRLRRKGLLESKVVEMACSVRGAVEVRSEWRAA